MDGDAGSYRDRGYRIDKLHGYNAARPVPNLVDSTSKAENRPKRKRAEGQ